MAKSTVEGPTASTVPVMGLEQESGVDSVSINAFHPKSAFSKAWLTGDMQTPQLFSGVVEPFKSNDVLNSEIEAFERSMKLELAKPKTSAHQLRSQCQGSYARSLALQRVISARFLNVTPSQNLNGSRH